MKRFLIRAVRFLVFAIIFLGVIYLTLVPCCDFSERYNTRNVSANPIPYFAVLVQSPDGKFTTRRVFELENDDEHHADDCAVVTSISDADVERINRDLRASIGSSEGKYQYFKVLRRGPGYVDVFLEVPTLRDWQFKNWYRIENGAIHQQKQAIFGPMTALFGGVMSLLSASFVVFLCVVLERHVRKRYVMHRKPSISEGNGGTAL